MHKHIYILGIGLSHNGSACILKDGKIAVAIEKERLTRIKHDGGNDVESVQYCLSALDITINDLSLIVQCANFEKEEIEPHRYKGNRLFTKDIDIPMVTISHHLAHAYSAVGTAPFDTCNVLVIDGCGSFIPQCDDLKNAFIPNHVNTLPGLYAEKDSYYYFNGQTLEAIYKDFSIINYLQKPNQVYLPTSNHSIGGLYAMASNYCFGDFDDAGKLMGLAPYGKTIYYQDSLFTIEDGVLWVNEANVHKHFTTPMHFIDNPFKENFEAFANIARWVQNETEIAIQEIFKHRLHYNFHTNICYAGGVALNAVANTKILENKIFDNLYIEPAAGDNGLALGCAYYGWLQVKKKEKIVHNGSTFFGMHYSNTAVEKVLLEFGNKIKYIKDTDFLQTTAAHLLEGKVVAWFQEGAEFGPRALGRRSILANPKNDNIKNHINANIKFREDFRPFAPSVLYEDKDLYFKLGLESPYMILIDYIKDEWKSSMQGIVHIDGTCRVQTVKSENDIYFALLQSWKKISGISVLLNTSFNKKGMPIVETPTEAINFFLTCALDVLVINDYIIYKND